MGHRGGRSRGCVCGSGCSCGCGYGARARGMLDAWKHKICIKLDVRCHRGFLLWT